MDTSNVKIVVDPYSNSPADHLKESLPRLKAISEFKVGDKKVLAKSERVNGRLKLKT